MRYHADKNGPLVCEISCRQEKTTGLLDIMQIRKDQWFRQERTTGLLDIMQIRTTGLLDIMQTRKDHWFT